MPVDLNLPAVFPLKSYWLIYSPVYFDILKYHRINEGLLKEVLNKDNLYLVGCTHLENALEFYFKDHYNQTAKYQKSENFDYLDVGAIIPTKNK